MKRETQNILLLLLGLALGVLLIKGAYVNYVKPALFPWLLATAGFLVALAVVSIVRDLRHGGEPPIEHGGEAVDGHGEAAEGHQHRGTTVWLLLVPVALIAFVVPPPVEASSAPPVSANQNGTKVFAPLPPGRAPTVALPDVMMRAATDSAGTLDNRLITIVGFTLKGADGPDLGRVVIICCSADAQLARVHLRGPASALAASYPDDTWLQVEGTVVTGSATSATSFVPTMNVTSVTKIDRPANTYAY